MNNTDTHIRGACSAKSSNDLDRLWADTAIDGELSAIATMPEGTNINKPGSLLFISLLKIASIVKGGYLPEHEALNSIKRSCAAFTWIPQKEIDYQWKRAYQKSEPRHRIEQNSTPTTQQKQLAPTRYQITQHDLVTGKTIVLCDVGEKTAVKSAELARMVSLFVKTGEIPQRSNLAASVICLWPNKAEIKLKFSHYGNGLNNCVILACHFLQGGMSFDYKNGQFDVIIPLEHDLKIGRK